MGSVFRYSCWDILNVAAIPLQVVLFVGLAFAYKDLSAATLLALVPVLYALALQNSGANHNHYHTPFFKARWLNTVTRMGYSLSGAPKTPHNIYHGHHHATKKSWNDLSFLKIVGLRRPLHQQVLGFALFFLESFGLKYVVFLVLLKRWPIERVAAFAMPDDQELAIRLFKRVREPAALRAAKLDIAAWVGFRVILCAIDWRFFFFYFVPTSYLVETLRMGEDFMHHWGAADPNDPSRDAVSCYGRLYNWLTFNLGYHQEHHLRPGAHWLALPAMTAELPTDRRTVPFSHYLNLPIFHPTFAASLARKRAQQTAEEAAGANASTT